MAIELTVVEERGVKVVEGPPDGRFMATVDDAVRVVEACLSAGVESALLYSENLTDGFFDLSLGEAGDILQELRNYRVRLAVMRPPGRVRFSSRGDIAHSSTLTMPIASAPTAALPNRASPRSKRSRPGSAAAAQAGQGSSRRSSASIPHVHEVGGKARDRRLPERPGRPATELEQHPGAEADEPWKVGARRARHLSELSAAPGCRSGCRSWRG